MSSGPGPIEDYALLSDLRTAALVGKDGSVDWLCLPRFDAPSCFSRLLDDEGAGFWRIGPAGEVTEVRRRYRDSSLILETDFHTPDGAVRLVDAMTPQPHDDDDSPELVRRLVGLSGAVEVSVRWVIRFAYGDAVPWVQTRNGAITAVAGPHAVSLHGDPLPVRVPGKHEHEARFTVGQGEAYSWVLQWTGARAHPPEPAGADDRIATTERFWRAWSGQIDYEGPHADVVHRSLVTLKALTYGPSGGIVAAPTTSLPEVPGGQRNWDYRYCWLRDATFTLLALDDFGCRSEAVAWRHWLLRAVAGDPGDVQIMYGVGGERHLLEWQADWLPGYHGAVPVRVGNGAYRQRQLDTYGEVMDVLHLARERGLELDRDAWALQRGMMEHLETVWQQPDKGLWEVRGPDRFFTHSRVMIWVAFDRAARAVRDYGLDGPAERWERLRDEVHAEVLAKGYNADIGAFTQYYGGTALDAATLLIPSVGFLPGDDPRVAATVDAIGRELKRGDLVDRYTTGEGESAVDGLAGREGAFLICSFWYVDALTLAGRTQEAEAMFARLAGLVNDVGLLSEEHDGSRFLGNFPQAFSHLGLANSAALLWGSATRYGRHRQNREVMA